MVLPTVKSVSVRCVRYAELRDAPSGTVDTVPMLPTPGQSCRPEREAPIRRACHDQGQCRRRRWKSHPTSPEEQRQAPASTHLPGATRPILHVT